MAFCVNPYPSKTTIWQVFSQKNLIQIKLTRSTDLSSNAPKPFGGWALPDPLGERTALPQTPQLDLGGWAPREGKENGR